MKIIKEFKKASLILLVLTILATGMNYIFQIVMGRMLSVEEFGMMNTLYAFVTIFTVPLGTISILVAKYIAECRIKEGQENAKKVSSYLGKFSFIIAIVLTIVLVFIIPYINEIYQVDSILNCILVVLCISTNIFIPFVIGFSQGFKMFFAIGSFNFILAFIKVVLSIIFIKIGYGVTGTMLSLLIANIFAACITGIIITTNLNNKKIRKEKKDLINYMKYSKYIGVAILANIILAYFTNIDMLLVKKYFSIQETGIYSSSILFSKIMLYIPNALATVIFPFVVEENIKQKNSIELLKKPIVYTIILSVIVCMGVNIFGERIVGIIFGQEFELAYTYVKSVVIMAIPMGIYTILVNFCLAIGEMKMILWSGSIGVIIYYIGTVIFHSSILQIIWGLAIVMSSIVIINIIYLYIKSYKVNKV